MTCIEGTHCECPLDHPLLTAILRPIWWLLPGRAQAWVVGYPCWAGKETTP